MDWSNFHWKSGLKECILNDIDFKDKSALEYKFDCPIMVKTEGNKKSIEFTPRFITKRKEGNILLADCTGIVFADMEVDDATFENVAKFIISGVNRCFDLYAEECKKRYDGEYLWFPRPTEQQLIKDLHIQKLVKNN